MQTLVFYESAFELISFFNGVLSENESDIKTRSYPLIYLKYIARKFYIHIHFIHFFH